MRFDMTKKEIKELLEKYGLQIIEIHDSIGSTNNRAIEICSEKEIDLGIVITGHQTSGRGRGVKKWEMKAGSGIALSIILGNTILYKNALGRMSGIGALAVVRAIETITGLHPKIKWPNDVLINGKKVCGILTEANWLGHELKSLVLGIGINVTKEAIPDIVDFPATAIEIESHKEINPGKLLDLIIFNLLDLLKQADDNQIIAEWEDCLLYKNKGVQIFKGNEMLGSGILLGLDDSGGIVIEMDENGKDIFYYGDVHLIVK